ncbi:solute carrier family 22 member 22-like [Callospermophilus lateralis]|uniref:solute carrier family 22 member 22-like n=1 Tax=Callospermophilus lateralis TaxID=76772 RepID=UPI004054917E
MAFEELLQHVGDNGKFQVLTTIFFMLSSILTSPHDYIENFTAAMPAHHCHVHLLGNPKFEANVTINLTAEALLTVSIPVGPNQKPEQCHRFHQTQWQLLDPNVSAVNYTDPETEPCLDGWIYDQSVFTSTIVTEWNLVCDYKSFKYFAQAIALSGHLVGSALSGLISDRFGRKPLLVSCCLAYGILSTCCAFAPVFTIYCILRFMSSVCLSAVLNNTCVFLFEGNSSKWQLVATMLFALSASIGQASFAGVAYLFRDWHMLQLVIALPYLILSLFSCGISESVRWLMATGKTEQALKELQRIARINGKKEVAESLTSEILISKMKEELNTKRESFRMKEIMCKPAVLKTVLFSSVLAFSTTFSFYGLLLDIENLGKNIFLTQFLLGITDLPSKCLSYFILKYVNRRPSSGFSLIILGVSILIPIFVPKEMYVLRLTLFLLGRSSVSVLSSILLIFSNELSATVLRSTIQGILFFVARTAATLSALVLSTRLYFVHLPAILFGTFPIVASAFAYFLPESFNLPLIETIKDMEKRYELRNKSTRKKQRKDLLATTEC